MKKKFIFQILILLQCIKISAQQTPTIIPPSPQAQAFMRYGEIPVSHSTGVPNIEIPIYTIEGKNLKLPISISYHASGIKVNDVASEVGLGWVLNCGGMVSRTIFGLPDEKNMAHPFGSATELLNSAIDASNKFGVSCGCLYGIRNFEYILDAAEIEHDLISDRFNYFLPNGISGVFRYDYSDHNNIIKLPYRALNIKKNISGTDPTTRKIDSFVITDEKGSVYKFHPIYNDGIYCSEWYLTEITSVDGTENIKLNYSPQPTSTSVNPTVSMVLSSAAFGIQNCTISGSDDSSISNQYSNIFNSYTPIIESIVSSTAVIKFTYKNDRTDFSNLSRLSEINIYPPPVNGVEQAPTKKIQFTKRDFGSGIANRLGLENVIIYDDKQPQKYSFTYEDNNLPPYPIKILPSPIYHEDFWGYSNGAGNTIQGASSLIPSDFISNSDDRGAYGVNRHADLSFSKACMLKQIQYPTGARAEFHFGRLYAENIYPYNTNGYPTGGYYGGFRVDSIVNYINDTRASTKSYEYRQPNIIQISKNYFSYPQHYYSTGKRGYTGSDYCWGIYYRNINLSSPILPLEVGVGLPVQYTEVIEYDGTKVNNTGKTVYRFNRTYSPADLTNFEGRELTPYEIMHDQNPRYYHPFMYDKGNYVPELLSKENYTSNGRLVFLEKNEYHKHYYNEFQTGIKLTRDIQYESSFFEIGYSNLTNGNTFQPWTELTGLAATEQIRKTYLNSVVALDTKAKQEATLLSNTYKYTYDITDQSKYVLETTNFEYSKKYLQLVKQTTTTSDSEKRIITEFKYPFDYIEQPYTTMVQMNNITPVIEQIDKVNTKPIKSIKMNHTYWKNDGVSSSVANGSMEIEKGMQNTSFSTFSITNSSEITIDMNLQMSIGHCKLSISGPTVINDFFYGRGSGEETFYTDYISKKYNLSPGHYTVSLSYNTADGYTNTGFYGTANYSVNTSGTKLNSSISSEPTNRIYPSSIDVKNGDNPYETKLNYNSYDMNGNILSISKNDNINEVYIWSYNTNYPIAKIVNGNYSTIEGLLGGWMTVKDFSLKQQPTNAEIQSFLAPLLDNTKEETKNILVTTYTYKPLVGMTSATDPRGVTTYYEYDDFNRLKQTYIIEAGVKKILQDFQYNYKN